MKEVAGENPFYVPILKITYARNQTFLRLARFIETGINASYI